GTLQQDFNLTSASRYGPDASGAVKLDSFVVATSRETDGAAIALNEQRFSPNIKNVVAADAMGDVMDGNVGEFLKFMPGITAEYDRDSGGSVSSVSVRGFPTAMAVVSGDGLQMASTGNTVGTSRVFQFTQVSINNISRLEVTKVPTPSSPADSMAGSVDMVSKSAFERKSAQFRYTFGVSGNPRTMSIRRVPHITDEREYKTLPSFTFDYTLPVTKNFGVVLTGQSQNRFIEMQWVPRTFNATAAGTGASFARPYLQSFQFLGVPRRNERNAAGLKDFRMVHLLVARMCPTIPRGRPDPPPSFSGSPAPPSRPAAMRRGPPRRPPGSSPPPGTAPPPRARGGRRRGGRSPARTPRPSR
ncbi:MAG: TonB-dependent receptor plug domain-containing protein, partial [Planctomycetaceae bacterium]|nr:TonB-dependent receptor plug domain-containing protein [Planctomycetaceae bacterium]